MERRRFMWISIFFLTLSLGLIASFLQRKPATFKGPIEKITFGNTPVYYSLLLIVAHEKGFFAQSGLEIDLKEYEYGALALEHLLKGDVDMAVAADFAFVVKSFDREDLRVVASIATSGSEEIVARKDRDIARVADLKGKRIGVSLGTSAEFTLMRFLLCNHLKPEEVTLVNLSPALLVDAISNGEVDAMIVWDKWIHEARKRLGENALGWPARIGQDFYWLVATTEGLIEKRPEAIERFLRAMVRAEEFVRSNKAEAQAIYIRRSGLDPAYVEYAWGKNRFAVSLDQGILAAMDGEAEWKIQAKRRVGRTVPNYLRYIYMNGLEAVNPRANTILR